MDDLTKVKKTTRWVIDTAKEGQNLGDQALIGSTLAFVALALLVINYFWIPAALFGGITIYRIIQHLLNRRSFDSLSELEQFDSVMDRKQQISQMNIPDNQKEIAYAQLNEKLGAIDITPIIPNLPERDSKVKSLNPFKGSLINLDKTQLKDENN
jgi:hypothetical protein